MDELSSRYFQMKKLTFCLVDIFGVEKYSGNQLAVFTDAMRLSDELMQHIAKEINYSEITLLTSPDLGDGG